MTTGRPRAVLRASLGFWGLVLAGAFAIVVLASSLLVVEDVLDGRARVATWIVVLVAFAGQVTAVTMVTVRWRTSLRSDGEALVLRGPWGASVIPLHDDLSIGRWLDRRQRPALWVLDGPRPLVPVSGRLGFARIEAFASVIGVPVIDHGGSPPGPDDSEQDDPYRPERFS